MNSLKKFWYRFLNLLFGGDKTTAYDRDGMHISETNGVLTVSLSDNIMQEIGEISFIQTPDINDQIKQGDQLLDVEGGKMVETFAAPANGKITDINDAILSDPTALADQSDWLVKIQTAS